MVQELIIKKSIELNAPIQKVWEALTDPELTKKYFFGCEVFSDWKEGSSIIFKDAKEGQEMVRGKIIKIKPGKFLKYTVWSSQSGLSDIPSNYSVVTNELFTENGKTNLSITQDNFGDDDEAEKRFKESDESWDNMLSGLKKIVE